MARSILGNSVGLNPPVRFGGKSSVIKEEAGSPSLLRRLTSGLGSDLRKR